MVVDWGVKDGLLVNQGEFRQLALNGGNFDSRLPAQLNDDPRRVG